MQRNPLTFYFGDRNPAINRLADQYGDYLERLAKHRKMLLINILSGVLYELATNPTDEYSIPEYLFDNGIHADDVGDLGLMFAQLDECETSTVEVLVMAIAIYAAEELR